MNLVLEEEKVRSNTSSISKPEEKQRNFEDPKNAPIQALEEEKVVKPKYSETDQRVEIRENIEATIEVRTAAVEAKTQQIEKKAEAKLEEEKKAIEIHSALSDPPKVIPSEEKKASGPIDSLLNEADNSAKVSAPSEITDTKEKIAEMKVSEEKIIHPPQSIPQENVQITQVTKEIEVSKQEKSEAIETTVPAEEKKTIDNIPPAVPESKSEPILPSPDNKTLEEIKDNP